MNIGVHRTHAMKTAVTVSVMFEYDVLLFVIRFIVYCACVMQF